MTSKIKHEIIDCHIHPAVDARTDVGMFQRSGDAAMQVAALRRAGIALACGAPVCRINPSAFSEIRELNDQALALRDRFPDFYIPGIHIHPHFPEESCAEIERCCGREGVRWIGELVGYFMGFAEEYATPEALTVFREAGKYHATVNFHCGGLDTIESLCRAVPNVNFVLAHPGQAQDEILKRIDLVVRFPNLYLDISGSGIDRLGVLRKAIDLAGKEKILFGTDFPVNNPAVYVHGAWFEQLRDEEYTALFNSNFRRLCGMK